MMIVLATSIRESSDLDWVAFAHLIGGMLYSIEIYIHHPVSSDGRLANLVYYDANDFALLIVCTVPFAVYFLRPGVKWWKRFIGVYSLVLFVTMIMKSGSRGGFLGFIAVLLFTLFRYKAVPTKLRVGAVFGGAALLLLVGSSAYWQMMGTLLHPNDDYNMTADVGRKAVWKRGIGYMWTHPILGVGIRAFPQAEGMLSKIAKKYAETGRGIKWSVAHNSFVEIGAECGVIALVLFLTMLGLTIRDSNRVRAGPRGSPVVTPDDTAFAQMLIASLVGYMVSGFFVSAEYFAYLYVILGLFLGQQAVLRRRLKQWRQTQHIQQAPAHHQITVTPKRQRRPAPKSTWLPAG
jgi:O-antigen ligase